MSDDEEYVLKHDLRVDLVLKNREVFFGKLEKFTDKKIAGPRFDRFVAAAHKMLGDKVEYDVLRESLRSLAGVVLTIELLDQTCWRLAGNLQRLQQFRVVPPWTKQYHKETVVAQVSDVQLAKGGRRGKELGHNLVFRILTGTPASLIATQWWSFRKSHFMAKYRTETGHGFMFPSPRHSRSSLNLYADGKQYFGLRCLLYIDPIRCDEDGPGFREISHSAATSRWNSELSQRRQRVKNFLCVESFPDHVECFQCAIGRDHCLAATHAQNYVWQFCDKCEAEAWFDPAVVTAKCCIGCTTTELFNAERDS